MCVCESVCACVLVGVGTLHSDLLLGPAADHCHTSCHPRPNVRLLLKWLLNNLDINAKYWIQELLALDVSLPVWLIPWQ